ncbi:lipid A biosynthesis lauroyl acyltransferase [Corynebacterium kutscheri]|uniref:Lauroyl/myristoyl acyltransferase n=1 Tax=Corynebacterium kutscheri TaxID=35755 RepID=A0A0F6R228_9CORY|nr:phosphatidylinositol mannoside acyltransferase [Corynebacterium kutscheri]AKE41353.1 Lauroyl/myristoyl acyltransferase [Corynebacterium kutscheri]VEH08629.1 lipid A biosynthesis lauroyl acyltransferase [Corynebacterium kutscheri]VEH09675.1 lipid A biosynthesis lauroyl acyltransferase [Corynebacterium kutscheri]VEH79758.1 lipid A biosynthesis lauroyl acyltransferase [Corynebacterium kutscheri]
MARLKLRSQLSTVGYLTGWKIVGFLPEKVAIWIFRMGADFVSKNGTKPEQLRKNLMRVVGPEKVTRELVRDAMRSYARYWCEAFRLPRLVGNQQLIERIHRGLVGEEYLRTSLNSGRGVVLVAAHSGNWDMAAYYFAHKFSSFTTVAERLEPEAVYQAFVDFRTSLGFQVLPLKGGVPPFLELRRVIQRGEVVCLLGERDLKRSGVEVEFFGETTRMPAGAVRLAQETGACLHVVDLWFEEDGWGIGISPEVKVEELNATVQKVAKIMEENIARHPQDWHVLQPLWLSDLDQDRYQKGLASPTQLETEAALE